MSKFIAVDGLTLAHAAGSPISGGTFTIVSTPSVKTKVDDKGVFLSPLMYTFAGGNASGFSSGTVATTVPQAIPSSALKVKDFEIALLLEGDSAIMQCDGALTGGGTGTVAGEVEISDAGQENTKGL